MANLKDLIVNGSARILGTLYAVLAGNATTATTATKLGTSTVGSTIKPIYLNAGTPTAFSATVGSTITPVYLSGGEIKALSYTIAKSVPADANFSNTTYSAGTGLSLSGTTFNHSNSVTAGTVGTSAATSGSTLAVPYVTYDAQGHVTGTGTHTHTVNGFVPTSRTVNGKTLSADVTLTYSDVSAASSGHTHNYVPTTRAVNSKTLSADITLTYSDVGAASSSHTHSGYASSTHKHTTADVTALTSYTIATQAAAIAATDSLNVALGKIQKSIDGKQASGSYVPTTRKVNNKALSADITLTYSDVSAASSSHTHSYTYSDVGAASASHTHTYTYSDVGAASASHTHTYSDVGAASSSHTHSGYQPTGTAVTHTSNTAVGTTVKPVYIATTGAATALSATVGSTIKPIYMNSGAMTALSATVGSTIKPVYMNSGAITALSATVGNTVTPVYMNAGAITALSYTIAKSVPADAVFTDTVYTHPTTSGNKHIPSGGSSGQILKWSADGTATWAAEYSYTHPTTSGNKHIPSGGSSGQFLKWSADGTATWAADNNTTYSAGSGLTMGTGNTINHSTTITAGTVGTSAATSGNTIAIPYVTYNATGHITAAGTHTHTVTATGSVKTDGISGATINRYVSCSTAAATAAKTGSVTAGTPTLEAGLRVSVKFANANTASNPTLNINSLGAKNIFVDGAQITTGSNKAILRGVVDFVYDGTQWHVIGTTAATVGMIA